MKYTVPIVEVAQMLDLKVHQIDTFTGWEVTIHHPSAIHR
jgi:hypothetical protein